MDPLHKHHADNLNIKPHEVTDVAREYNFVHQKIMALINYIKNAIRSIAYAISPKSNPAYISHMHGEDIAMAMPMDCGNEVVNQEMLKFSDHVHKFWENNTPEEVVDFFVKSAVKNAQGIQDAIQWVHLVEDGVISDITQDELTSFSNICDRLVYLDMATKMKKYGDLEFVIKFRDIKNFYNVFIKYMNYAIKNNPKNAVKVADLEKLFFGDVDMTKRVNYGKDFRIVGKQQMDELFDKSKVSDSDRDILRSDDDFIMLLQSLKEYVPTRKEYKSGDEHNTFYNLVGNILGDNKDHPMNYTDLKRLKRSADIVGNILAKKHNGKLTQPEYYFGILQEASRLALVPGSLGKNLDIARYFKARDGEKISEKDIEEIILSHGFGEKVRGLMIAMESLPDIVNKALAQIDLDTQLKHVIKLNILHESY